MPEFNRNFALGLMNKDVDERIVPKGQYRDALNVEVTTSEGSNAGALETLMGNLEQTPGSVPDGSYCVGSITNGEENSIYYLVEGANLESRSDYILRYNVSTEELTYVFVDRYQTTRTCVGFDNFNVEGESPVINLDSSAGVRPGMVCVGPNGTIGSVLTLTDPDSNQLSQSTITLEKSAVSNFQQGQLLTFTSSRILNFSKSNLITGINIVDDLLMFTDNYTEPKKINISRSIKGTGSHDLILANGENADYHTRLVSTRVDGSFTSDGLEVVRSVESYVEPMYCELDNVTVIKKSPLTPPTLTMSAVATEDRIGLDENPNNLNTMLVGFEGFVVDGNAIETGSLVTLDFSSAVDYRVGDFILLTSDMEAPSTSFVNADVRLKVVATPQGADADNVLAGSFGCEVQAISEDLADGGGIEFFVRLEQDPSLFEFKFPRFAYRYKYVDGEYSSFSPFSEVAFLPGQYEYEPKKGYNLAMANRLRKLDVHNYAPQYSDRAKDIVEIDILYKEDKSTSVYTVKTIKPSDGTPLWPNYNNYASSSERGTMEIKSELIHAVVASNQLIRPWDNVPRKALAQEVTGNRLLFANYLQNYNLEDKSGKLLTPNINLGFKTEYYEKDDITMPEKSLKSMRTYQLGVVYKDEFGRETPVLADKEKGSITIEKEYCNDVSSLTAKITSNAPKWAKSFKFFLKETASEYYNLAMAKWYNAEDGNVWVSFNSSDRNKIDIDTFLELKKAHDSDTAVEERARYKVIAIENEAPEDIRIDRQQQGVLVNTGNNKIGDINEGFPFADFNFITLDEDAYLDAFPDVATIASECSVRIQNTSGSERSEFYDIKSIEEQDNGFYKLSIIKKFGPDVNFCSTADTYNTRISGLAVIIVKNKRVDKPEFDGKFFVKLYRDLLLEKYIMVTSDDNYVVDQAFNLGYLCNYHFEGNSAAVGGIAQYATVAAGDDEDPQTAGNEMLAPQFNPYNTSYEWGDNPTGFDDYDNLSSNDQRRILVEESSDNVDTGFAYWHSVPTYKNSVRVLIDECNAFMFDLQRNTFDSDNDQPWEDGEYDLDLRFHHDEMDNALENYIWGPTNGSVLRYVNGIHKRTQTPSTISQPGVDKVWGSSNVNNFSWMNGARGVYSVDNVGMIDISVFGIAPGRYTEDLVELEYVNHLALKWRGAAEDIDDSLVPGTAAAKKFINRIINNETKFRFRQDPDKTVYEVQAWREHQGIFNYFAGEGNAAKKRTHVMENKRVKYSFALDKIIGADGGFDPRSAGAHDGSKEDKLQLEFLAPYATEDGFDSDNPAVFETYPKENIELDIYYEIGRAYPISLQKDNAETLALIGDKVKAGGNVIGRIKSFDIEKVNGSAVKCAVVLEHATSGAVVSLTGAIGQKITIEDSWGGTIQLEVNANYVNTDTLPVNPSIHKSSALDPDITFGLDWFNCYSFGNGVESNRIRDDFNQPTIQNGVKASTTIAEQYKEERRGTGLIYSGIYNSTSGVNRLNQFIQGEKITKDINPDNGSIQKLFARDTNIVTFCEDRVLKILSNKDALFSADGDSNVTATAKVLGAVTPFVGDYGISKNPESFAADEYRCYFTDQQRGAVLRLSKDGLTPISSVGMKDYFNDTMADPLLSGRSMIMGSFDSRKSEYNLTFQTKYPSKGTRFDPVTITFNEDGKGWVSFKSFVPQDGVSINNNYYTMSDGSLWKHHVNETRNMFYGVVPGDDQYSNVTLIFNDSPSSVKNFQTVKYEGTQARINQFTTVSVDGVDYTDKEFYNLNAKNGWYVEHIETDMAEGKVLEFINKENKWFNKISGVCTNLENLDEQEFQVQGIGIATIVHSDPDSQSPLPLTFVFKDFGTGDNEGWD